MIDSRELQPVHEVEVEPRSIAIATTTFYKKWYPGEVLEHDIVDKVRGDLALQLIREAIENGYQMSVVDGGSSPAFKSTAEAIGITVYPELERGMSASRRQAFAEASHLDGVKIICWTEPEKVSIIKDCMPVVVLPILRGETDIVIPSRDETAFKTYPDYQVKEEQRANRQWNGILRARGFLPNDSPDLDVWFGPKFFRNDPEIIKLFSEKYDFRKRELKIDKIVDPELWPNATFLPIVAALYRGFRVKSVPVPYLHPKEQTEIEVDNPIFVRKRGVQRKNIIVSTMHLIRMLESNAGKGSRLELAQSK